MLELFLSDVTTMKLLILYLELSPLILNVQRSHIPDYCRNNLTEHFLKIVIANIWEHTCHLPVWKCFSPTTTAQMSHSTPCFIHVWASNLHATLQKQGKACSLPMVYTKNSKHIETS